MKKTLFYPPRSPNIRIGSIRRFRSVSASPARRVKSVSASGTTTGTAVAVSCSALSKEAKLPLSVLSQVLYFVEKADSPPTLISAEPMIAWLQREPTAPAQTVSRKIPDKRLSLHWFLVIPKLRSIAVRFPCRTMKKYNSSAITATAENAPTAHSRIAVPRTRFRESAICS